MTNLKTREYFYQGIVAHRVSKLIFLHCYINCFFTALCN